MRKQIEYTIFVDAAGTENPDATLRHILGYRDVEVWRRESNGSYSLLIGSVVPCPMCGCSPDNACQRVDCGHCDPRNRRPDDELCSIRVAGE